MVTEGELAPDFTLPNESGQPVTLSELRGKPVVLYFYPKDNTSGLYDAGVRIRDAWSEFEARGRGRARRLTRRRRLAREVQGAATGCRSPCSPTRSTPSPRRYGVWAREVALRAHLYGHRPLDLRDRRRRQGHQGDAKRAARDARRRRARGSRGLRPLYRRARRRFSPRCSQ